MERTERPNIKALEFATYQLLCGEDQVICETTRAYELWQRWPLQRIKRWSKSAVLWVHTIT